MAQKFPIVLKMGKLSILENQNVRCFLVLFDSWYCFYWYLIFLLVAGINLCWLAMCFQAQNRDFGFLSCIFLLTYRIMVTSLSDTIVEFFSFFGDLFFISDLLNFHFWDYLAIFSFSLLVFI